MTNEKLDWKFSTDKVGVLRFECDDAYTQLTIFDAGKMTSHTEGYKSHYFVIDTAMDSPPNVTPPVVNVMTTAEIYGKYNLDLIKYINKQKQKSKL